MGTGLGLVPREAMNIKRAAERASVTHKALKYYEAIGLQIRPNEHAREVHAWLQHHAPAPVAS